MNRRDTIWVIAFLVFGVAGVWTFLNWQDRAFPIASIDFKVSRDEAFDLAAAYAAGQGHNLDGFEHAQTFGYDQAVQIFLQKTLGLETSNALARDWVSVWTWQMRWFKPLEKEEIHVEVDPGGRVVFYEHVILDTVARASLPIEAARDTAQAYLVDRAGITLNEWDPIESSSEVRKSRTDHTFTYRKRGWSAGDDGHYRARVVVKGNRVGRYGEYLHVPESFLRGYREIRSRANLLSQAFSILWIALAVAVVVIVARRYRAGTLPWHNGGIVAIAVTVAMVVMALNSWPLVRYNYETTQAYGSFMGTWLMMSVVGAIFLGGIVGLAAAAGQSIGRETFGLRVMPTLSLNGLLAGRFAKSTLIGYGLAGFHLGYVVLFYLIGNRFGVWSPAELQDYSETFSTMFPWIYPLVIGLIASTNEEFFFRLVAISLLMRWTGIKWLSVLIPAIVWAFLHANYPQEPIYIRGIELTVVGCLFGAVFLRWGIWTVVTSHYAFNAFLGAYPMMNSSSSYFQISGIAVVGLLTLPLLVSLYGWATGRVDASEREEIAESSPSEQQVRSIHRAVDVGPAPASWSLTQTQRGIAAGTAAIGLAALFGLSPDRFGQETLRMTQDRSMAFEVADSARAALGWALPDAHTVSWYEDALDEDDHTYLIRKRGISGADSLIHATSQPRRWTVRWFAPLEKTELSVGVSVDGRVAFADRKLPENASGATLAKEEAQALARGFLVTHFQIDVSDGSRYKLLESTEEKLERRLDHDIVWERTDVKVEDGKFWIRVGIQGDEIGAYDLGFTAPEPFLRQLNEQSLTDGIASGLRILVLLATGVLGGTVFLRLYREDAIVWRAGYAFGIVMALCIVTRYLNGLPIVYAGYGTEEALGTFIASQGFGLLVQVTVVSLLAVLMMGLANALCRDQLPEGAVPGRWLSGLFTGDVRGRLLLDSVIAGVGLRLLWSGFSALSAYVEQAWFPQFSKATGFSPSDVDTYFPAAGGVTGLAFSVLAVLAFFCGILIWKRALKQWARVGLAAVLFFGLLQIGQAEELSHAAVSMVLRVVQLLAVLWLARMVVGTNLLAYFFAMVLGPLLESGIRLMSTELMFYDVNGALLLLLAVSPIVYGILTLGSRPDPSRVTPSPNRSGIGT
jgi:hypothetical protein